MKLRECLKEAAILLSFRCRNGDKSDMCRSRSVRIRERANGRGFLATLINCDDAVCVKSESSHGVCGLRANAEWAAQVEQKVPGSK